ncbi:MAG: hypothetical protein IJL20_02995 [Lachnospiraceae bacterium]|nr:hypothetical protein [Lachnospiraceae bacterium]
MTIEELKEHCVRQITEFERIKEIMPVTPNGYKHYEEHKIVLQLIEAISEILEQKPRKGEWLRMSDLSEQKDNRYKCSRCGNVVHHRDKINLYTFNSWCGRCGSDNGRKSEVSEYDTLFKDITQMV